MERYQKWMLTTDVVENYRDYVNDLSRVWIDTKKQQVKTEGVKEEVKKEMKKEMKQFRYPKDFDILFWHLIRLFYPDKWTKVEMDVREKMDTFQQMDYKYEFVVEWGKSEMKSLAREVITKVRWGDVLNDVGSSARISIETFITLVEVLSYRSKEREMPDVGTIVLCRTRCIQCLTGEDYEHPVLWVDLKRVDTKYIPTIGKYDSNIVYIVVKNIWKPLHSISKYKVGELETMIAEFGLHKEDHKYKKVDLYELISNYLDTM
jgi:hypothetical protein